VKLLVREPGTAAVADVWLAADRRVSSALLYPETRAALARAGRMGRLDRRGLAATRSALELLWAAVDRVEPTKALLTHAGDLAEQHALRAYDAVHLASFEEIADAETVLAAADGELLAAARARGFTTAPAR